MASNLIMWIASRAISLIAFFVALEAVHFQHVEAAAAPFSTSPAPSTCFVVPKRPSSSCCPQCHRRKVLLSSTYSRSNSYSSQGSRAINRDGNGGWAKTELLPEASCFKAARDEDRIQKRREREVARAVGAITWNVDGQRSFVGGSKSGSRGSRSSNTRQPSRMTLLDDDNGQISKEGDNSNGSVYQKTSSDNNKHNNSNHRQNDNKRQNGSKRQNRSKRRSYASRNKRRRDSGKILTSFTSVEDIKELNRLVDELLLKLEENQELDSTLNKRRMLSPKDVTAIVRLLGARSAYDACLRFVRHPATEPNVFSYTAACASLAQASDPKYRSQAPALLDEMDALLILPSTYTFTAILLGIDGGADALKFMERARRQYKNSVEVNVFLYNAAIHACSRSPRASTAQKGQNDGWQTALMLFRQMKKDKIEPNEQTYASLLHACGKSGQVKLALSLLNEMKLTPSISSPDAKVWGAVLQVLASAGNYKKATQIMKEMVLSDGISPNILHCNALLASLSKARQDAKAIQLLECMTNGTFPDFIIGNATVPADVTIASADLISINTVLNACSRKHNYRAAEDILRKMKDDEYQSENGPIRPDSVSYNSILSACHEPVQVERILKEMRLSRRERYSCISPTAVTYTNAITVCRRSEPPDLNRARRFLEDAIREGVQPNLYMYSAAIWTAERSGAPEVALDILNEMKSAAPSRHCKPNAVSYDGVISAYASQGRYKECLRLMQEMKNFGLSPTPTTYKKIAIAMDKAKLLSDANVIAILEPLVFGGMKKDDRTAVASGPIIASLIRAYGACRLYTKAKKTFRLMRGPTDSSCLSAMLYSCAKASRWQDALFFLHTSDIVADAQGPGRIDSVALTYACISCARADQWREALNIIDLYGRFAEDGNKAIISVNAVNSLISACGRSGRADMAVKLLNEMPVRFQCLPDEQSYRFAIIACNQAEKRRQRGRERKLASIAKNSLRLEWWEVALSLLRRMREDALVPDAQVYSSVISACESGGQWQRALGVLRSMSVTTGEIPTPPNLYCFNSAISACEKGGAWLEAVELYERIKSSGKIRPNFVTISSLLIALEEAGQREMSTSIYKEAVRDNILSPWKYRNGQDGKRIRAMDLHQFSAPLARVAVRTAIESLLNPRPQWNPNEDLVIIVGKGKRSESGIPALRPVIEELLEDMGLSSNVPINNNGRLVVQSRHLIEYSKRMSWLEEEEDSL